MKRLFIGIPIESETVLKMTAIWRNDQVLNHHVVKWVNPENWHVTLIFLGDTPESSVSLLQQLIEESFSKAGFFGTELKGIGVFPSSHNPKVLWLGLEDIQSLMPFYNRLAEMLHTYGFVLDSKPLKPHLSLARVKNPDHNSAFDLFLRQYQSHLFGSIGIYRVVLYESTLTTNGPVYKPLFVKELN